MLNNVIAIATTPDRYDWLQNCLESLKGYKKYPIVIISDYTYFFGKMDFLSNKTKIESFTMISDSMVIKDTSLFDLLFEKYRNKNVSYTKNIPYPYWLSLGKFLTKTLRAIDIPRPKTKKQELKAEITFKKRVMKADPSYVGLFDDLPFDDKVPNPNTGISAYMEYKFGRNNRVIENDYFIKYQIPQ